MNNHVVAISQFFRYLVEYFQNPVEVGSGIQ